MNKRGRPGRAASRPEDDTQKSLVLASSLTTGPEPPKPQARTGLFRLLAEDVRTVVERDPSVRTFTEALLHPALPALCAHRVAHLLHARGARLWARALMTTARAVTGTEIHPGATLGRRVFIDHGAAVVIGETAVVGDDVTIYHQVTLGAVGWWRDNRRPPGERRHPVVGNGTVLGTGATVLGPVTIGDRVVVGARALVLTDLADDTHVSGTHPPAEPHTAPPSTARTP